MEDGFKQMMLTEERQAFASTFVEALSIIQAIRKEGVLFFRWRVLTELVSASNKALAFLYAPLSRPYSFELKGSKMFLGDLVPPFGCDNHSLREERFCFIPSLSDQAGHLAGVVHSTPRNRLRLLAKS